MKETNNYKNNILHFVIIILLFLVTIFGVAYAYYTGQLQRTNGTASAEFSAKTLGVNFTDGPNINLTGVLPGATIIKTFTVSNTGDTTGIYNINLIDVTNDFDRPTDIVYTLTSDNSGANVAQTVFPGTDLTIGNNISIATGVTQHYTLTIQYLNADESQNIDMNKNITATIQIADQNDTISLEASGIEYTNPANPNVHTVADALDDLAAKLS